MHVSIQLVSVEILWILYDEDNAISYDHTGGR